MATPSEIAQEVWDDAVARAKRAREGWSSALTFAINDYRAVGNQPDRIKIRTEIRRLYYAAKSKRPQVASTRFHNGTRDMGGLRRLSEFLPAFSRPS